MVGEHVLRMLPDCDLKPQCCQLLIREGHFLRHLVYQTNTVDAYPVPGPALDEGMWKGRRLAVHP